MIFCFFFSVSVAWPTLSSECFAFVGCLVFLLFCCFFAAFCCFLPSYMCLACSEICFFNDALVDCRLFVMAPFPPLADSVSALVLYFFFGIFQCLFSSFLLKIFGFFLVIFNAIYL